MRRVLLLSVLAAFAVVGFAPAAHAAPSSSVAYVTDFGLGVGDPNFLGSSIFVNAITGSPPPAGLYTTASGTVTHFSDVSVATVDGTGLPALAAFDTVMLYQVCDFGSHAGLIAALNSYLANGLGKVVIYDGDGCATGSGIPTPPGSISPDYSKFLFPFATSNPGPRGSVQSITFVEAEAPPATLTKNVLLGTLSSDSTDAIGDSNTFTSNAGGWCAAVQGNNALGVNGIQVAYARTALGGLAVFNGQDNWFTFGANSYDKLLFDNTLDQPTKPDTLPCGAPTSGIKLGPASATNPVGTSHTVTATVSDSNGKPIAGVTVNFVVKSGPNAGKTGTGLTDASGNATFTYSDTGGAGTDTISASFIDSFGATHTSNDALKTWQNNDCRSATLLLGYKTIPQTTIDQDVAGKAEAFRATATASGTESVICVFIAPTNAATQLVAGIYADNAGHPGALLSQGTNPGPLTNGVFNTVQIPPVPEAAGTKYWIAILSKFGDGTLRFRDHCCGFQSNLPTGPSENSKVLTLTALPAVWVSGDIWPKDGPLLGWSGG